MIEEEKTPGIFTNKVISTATFFGGPLAAGFLIGHNYKVFGNRGAAGKARITGLIFTLLLLAIIAAIPEATLDRIPSAIIPAIYTAAISFLVERLQGESIREFLLSKGQKASGWLAAGYGAAGAAAILLFAVTVFSVAPIQGYKYNIQVNEQVNLHYDKRIADEESDMIKLLLDQSGFFDNSEGADLFLSNNKGLYELKMIVDREILTDTLIINELNTFEKFLNYNIAGDRRIKLSFTDELMKESYEAPWQEDPGKNPEEELMYLMQYQVSENHAVLYNVLTPVNDIEVLARSMSKLKGYFPPAEKVDIVLLNKGDRYIIKFFVIKELWNNQAITERLRKTVEYIRMNGIQKSIDIYLIDSHDYSETMI
jgi:hypothetical protein